MAVGGVDVDLSHLEPSKTGTLFQGFSICDVNSTRRDKIRQHRAREEINWY